MFDDLKSLFDHLMDRLSLQRPATQTINDQPYALKADGTLGEPVRKLAPQWTKPTLVVSTLGGMVDAYQSGIDSHANVALQIVDHLTVNLIAVEADDFGRRHVFVTAKHVPETPFRFGVYEDPEEFLIKFRASFLFNESAVNVQQLCSTVGSGDAVMVSDDGISQEVQIKSGTVTRSSIALPADGIPLIPWRTFRDAAPVESKFLLRMKGVKDKLPQIAIHEIDAKWKLETVHSIKHYFEKNLPEAKVIA